MTTADSWAIDLAHVEKVYRGKVRALNGIEMRVRRGEIFGLLGPNGAGKSTLVKIILTIVRPTRADGTVLDRPVGHKPTLGRIGFLPEHHRMPGYLSGRQAVDYYGALAGVPKRERTARIDAMLDLVGMSQSADRKIAGYSKGMMQRIGLAQALINEPDLVILDEPTDGVDPVGRRDIRDLLKQLRNEGKTVFVNSHILSELELVCDRVAILQHGEVVSQGTVSELTQDSRRYEIEIQGAAPADLPAQTATTPLPDGGTRITWPSDDPQSIQPLLDGLRRDGRVIVNVHRTRESLEDLFVRSVVDGPTGDAPAPATPSPNGGAGAPAPAPAPPPPTAAPSGPTSPPSTGGAA